MKVPFLDVGATYRELAEQLDRAVSRVLTSGHYILGEEVEAFESEYAASLGADYCIGVGNGLDALALSLRGLGVGPGDEVIVPSHTFIATWLAVTSVGARVVPVEPCRHTWNLDPERVAAAVTARTRAIMPVHLYGSLADVETIARIARKAGAFVIEDAAQAHGARWGDAYVGKFADAVCWSFYPGKNLGAFGDGGAITTNNAALAGALKKLRNYGSERKYQHELQGCNSRLDPLQAAILRVKLPVLKTWNDRRASIAQRYQRALADVPGVTTQRIAGATSWHLFVVSLRERDALRRRLAELEIETGIHYPTPPHLQPAYAELDFRRGSFPIAESLSESVLSLPIGPHLSDEAVAHVISALAEVLRDGERMR